MDDDEALLMLNERRAARALEKAPELIGYIRSLVIPGGGVQDGTPRAPKSDPPLPFRADAMDDSDRLFRILLWWSDRWLGQMQVKPIPSEFHGWRIDGDTWGFPANVTPAGAQSLTYVASRWLIRQHPSILSLPQAGTYFDRVSEEVGRLRGSYPMAPRPPRRALRRECSVCGEHEVVARIPQDVRDTEVFCMNCGFEIEYESYAGLVEGWLK
ncbi:hypothetical protein ACFRFH_12035 [Leifsonia sp. NPDC056824]|uniref:hypothetical protein n=1 Tax=Leifsonia sp. NPDC056824 TaxID=3345953 RepID=UPI0036A16488